MIHDNSHAGQPVRVVLSVTAINQAPDTAVPVGTSDGCRCLYFQETAPDAGYQPRLQQLRRLKLDLCHFNSENAQALSPLQR